ncbi:hypothetical protein SMI01S_16270 [Sphingobacterium mizutaii NBRC 14946 = DSM 11724]|uniref:Uncharacterized protein n=2 Tax=Sphingobacterium mizutaii TaxID=1010 RepID=A0AAJ4X871_9SPHI|nr:hypothetical protein [Sphingobacterium mizutaii]GEM68021.1 hypothetical protein SMI01S_16270 [Sphingobacterium mizutaii NBRC 14946 = DSM 11724]SDL78238.1 hypothetical protein SAMN05192578_10956 [Sphingobacterium mizutaii]SNV37831.1 Uncharacterised protein [Sphingobacterium mizutaii]
MKKDLVLVANKPPINPIGNIIDSFDKIIRINKMDHLGHSGNRIDGLYLEMNHDFVVNCGGGKNKEYFKNANHIFIRNFINKTF